MSGPSWGQGLAWALAALFALGFVINSFAVKLVGPEYRRWGCPDWFHFMSSGRELAVALLLPAIATCPFGVGLGGCIMLAAVETVIYHREYRRAVPPFIALLLLAIVG